MARGQRRARSRLEPGAEAPPGRSRRREPALLHVAIQAHDGHPRPGEPGRASRRAAARRLDQRAAEAAVHRAHERPGAHVGHAQGAGGAGDGPLAGDGLEESHLAWTQGDVRAAQDAQPRAEHGGPPRARAQYGVSPPSTLIDCPRMIAAASDRRKATTRPTSIGWMCRPSCAGTMRWTSSLGSPPWRAVIHSATAASIGVSTPPGHTALTLMRCGAHSAARERVRLMTAALPAL